MKILSQKVPVRSLEVVRMRSIQSADRDFGHGLWIWTLADRGLRSQSALVRENRSALKLKFHWDQFPRNFPVANVTGKSPTSYEEVRRVVSLLRGSHEEAGDFQTISTCQDGHGVSLTSS